MISNRDMIDQGNSNVYGNELMNQVISVSRKRSRDLGSFDPSVLPSTIGQFVSQTQLNNININNINNNQKGMFTFLGQDISMQIYEQQVEIDRFVSQHTEKVRSEIEAARRRITTRLTAVAEEGMNILRSKEDEIIKIGGINYALEEKVKSLTIDNQIWQQMAQTNEAAANVLRRRLQQILTQVQQQKQQQQDNELHDSESCCGSNYDIDDDESQQRRRLVKGNDVEAYCSRDNNNNNGGSRCRKCGKEELCVLLLPCRHLCVCTVCESSINVCPICKSIKNASVHVNMNSF